MGLTWEEAEVAALNRQEWRRSSKGGLVDHTAVGVVVKTDSRNITFSRTCSTIDNSIVCPFSNFPQRLCRLPEIGRKKLFDGIGVARILYGVHFFPKKKLTTFLVVALKRQSKTTKWTTPTYKSSTSSKNVKMSYNTNWLLLCLGVHLVCWGALTNFPFKLRLKKFFSALGVQVHSMHPWQRLCLTGNHTCFRIKSSFRNRTFKPIWPWKCHRCYVDPALTVASFTKIGYGYTFWRCFQGTYLTTHALAVTLPFWLRNLTSSSSSPNSSML